MHFNVWFNVISIWTSILSYILFLLYGFRVTSFLLLLVEQSHLSEVTIEVEVSIFYVHAEGLSGALQSLEGSYKGFLFLKGPEVQVILIKVQ